GERRPRRAELPDGKRSPLTFLSAVLLQSTEANVRSVILEDSNDEKRGRRYRAVVLHDNGDLRIEGQDLGGDVEEFFGCYEYEFARTIRKEHVPALARLLGGDEMSDVLALVEARFAGKGTRDLELLLEANGLP